MIASEIGGGLVLLYVLIMWAWFRHCLFFFHCWDNSRKVTDLCVRCGAIRFKP